MAVFQAYLNTAGTAPKVCQPPNVSQSFVRVDCECAKRGLGSFQKAQTLPDYPPFELRTIEEFPPFHQSHFTLYPSIMSRIIDPEGDIVLIVGQDDNATDLRVSSKALSLASPVFGALFKPKFREGVEMRPTHLASS